MSDIRQEIAALLPRMMRFAYSLTGSEDEAREIVQSACERALSRMDQFIPGTHLDRWLFRITHSIWIDRMRASKYRSKIFVTDDSDAAHDARIHEEAEAKQILQRVHAEILRLPEPQRTALVLVTIDGRSYQEAAEMLQVPIGTIMSRLARARRALVENIELHAQTHIDKTESLA